MIVKPSKVHAGTFKTSCHVPSAKRRFVFDSENRVFEITDNLDLRPCGTPACSGSLDGLAGKRSYGGVSFHPQKELAAFVTENGMAVSDFHGSRLWEYTAPVTALLFSRNGDEIWIAENIDSETLLLSVVDAETGMENSANTMKDPLYQSALHLSHAPETVLLTLAAGQDGIAVWELDDAEPAMRYRDVFPKHCCHITPAFHPDGRRLLTLENDEHLFYSYSWPEAALIAKQRDLTEAERDDEENYNNYYFVYLSNGLAIVQSALDRLYLFDPEKMERLEELVIEGFEPVPTREMFFPNLQDDETLHSPIAAFERMGDVFAARTGKRIKNQAMVLIAEDDLIKNLRLPIK